MKKRMFLVCALVLAICPGTHAANKGGLGAMFGALIGGAVGSAAGKSMADPQTIEKALLTMTNQLNQKMPMTVDADTRLDNATAGQGSRFTYNYTIVSATSREVDRAAFPAFLTKLKAGVCSSPDMAIFFKYGVTVGYSYRASDGVFITKIDITPKDCGYPV